MDQDKKLIISNKCSVHMYIKYVVMYIGELLSNCREFSVGEVVSYQGYLPPTMSHVKIV